MLAWLCCLPVSPFISTLRLLNACLFSLSGNFFLQISTTFRLHFKCHLSQCHHVSFSPECLLGFDTFFLFVYWLFPHITVSLWDSTDRLTVLFIVSSQLFALNISGKYVWCLEIVWINKGLQSCWILRTLFIFQYINNTYYCCLANIFEIHLAFSLLMCFKGLYIRKLALLAKLPKT